MQLGIRSAKQGINEIQRQHQLGICNPLNPQYSYMSSILQ